MASNLQGQGQVPQSQGHMGAFRNTAISGPGIMTTAGQDMNMGENICLQWTRHQGYK